MNRSAFQKRLARVTAAVALTVSAIGCATAPESASSQQAPLTEDSSQSTRQPAADASPEIPDVSFQSPAATLPVPSASKLEEPSPVWIDDALARRTPPQPTEIVVQPPSPEIEARAAVASEPPSPADQSEPPSRATRAISFPTDGRAGSLAERSPLLAEPRVPVDERASSLATAPVSAPATVPAQAPSPATGSGSEAAPVVASQPTDSSQSASRTTSPSSATSSSTPREAATRGSLDSGRMTSSATFSGAETSGAEASRESSAGGPAAAQASESAPPTAVESAPTATAPVSAATDPTASGPTTRWNERAATVASGSEFSVVLPGSGWLYVGKEYGDGEIRLLGKSRSDGDEVFRFRIGEPGDYGLWFQQQDSLSGSLLNERLSVRAGDDEEPSTISLANLAEGSTLPSPASERLPTDATSAADRVSSVIGGADASPDSPGSDPTAEVSATEPSAADALDRALGLLEGGRSTDALSAFVEGTDRGFIAVDALEDDVVERFVEVARDTEDVEAGRSPVIRSFWRTVASSGSAAAPEARRALLEIAARTGDAGEIAASVSALEAAGEASVDDMTRAANALLAAGRESEALPLLARAVSRDESAAEIYGRLADDRLFALAQLLEQPGPDRDLRTSASLYRLILDERPLSGHWDASRSRLEYLRRHYFEVR